MDRELFPYIQLNDSAFHHGSQGILPGDGFVPLYDYLDCLPADIDISVEAQIPPNNVYTGAEWSKICVERIKHFLTRYYAPEGEVGQRKFRKFPETPATKAPGLPRLYRDRRWPGALPLPCATLELWVARSGSARSPSRIERGVEAEIPS